MCLGIGLFQSKMIVEAHQAKIEVESAVDKGSTCREQVGHFGVVKRSELT